MADTLENMQETHIRRSDKTESRPNEETNGRAPDSRLKTINKNVAVGYYDKPESMTTSQKKGDEDETQNSIETRPEKKAKTVTDSSERFEDLGKTVVDKDVTENLSLDAQENVPEQIERQRREEADQEKLQQQSNDETETNDQPNNDQQRGAERKGRDVRSRLEQFYSQQRTKKQQFQAQQQQEPTQQQPLASHFHLYPLVEKLANAVETGTRDQNSDALMTELTSCFNKSQQMLNSLSGSLGSKPVYVDGEKRKLEDTEKLLQQRRGLIAEYRKSIEDILKKEP